MDSRKNIKPWIAVALGLALIALLVWKFFSAKNGMATALPPKATSSPAIAVLKNAPSPAVEAPKAAPAPVSPGNATTPDSQENLTTAIADVVALAQGNDFITLFARYGAPAVDPTLRYRGGGNISDDLQQKILSFQSYISSPQGLVEQQQLQTALEYLKTQTPVYNDAGDQATIQTGPITEQQRAANLIPEITFIKKDGRWYLRAGNPFGW